MGNRSFSYDELILPYSEWEKLSRERESELHESIYKWYRAWRLQDLALSPIDDNQRRFIRYGHFTGWFNAKRTNE